MLLKDEGLHPEERFFGSSMKKRNPRIFLRMLGVANIYALIPIATVATSRAH